MDVFVINRDGYQADFDAMITEYESLTWVERYNKPGEFTMIGSPVPLRDQLLPGTWISHSMSKSIMVVETHIIEDGKLYISGRTIDAFIMDRRVVKNAFNMAWDSYNVSIDNPFFDISYASSWDTVRIMLDRFLISSEESNERIPNLWSVVDPSLWYYTEAYTIRAIPKKLSLLSDAVYDILQSADTGLRVERPSPERPRYFVYGGDGGSVYVESDDLAFVLHQGKDLSDDYSMIFSWNDGDLMNPRYLWTVKDSRNGFYSHSHEYTKKYFESGKTAWDCALTSVDVEDFDPEFAADSYQTRDILTARGFNHISKESSLNILVEAKVTKTATPKFGIDYQLGDLVPVLGQYGVSQTMRVIEYAMIFDKGGHNFIPTLANDYSISYYSSCG